MVRGLLHRRDFLTRAGLLGLAGATFGCRGLERGPGQVARRGPAKTSDLSVGETPRASLVAPRDGSLEELELLPTPDLSPARVLRNVAGIRPFRRGAIRLEVEDLAGRPLVHDYGHGGAGLTLSRGSALEVLALLRARCAAPAEVAVLGAGVNGLTVATLLGDAGYDVRVYAARFSPDTTSSLAGGQFAPSLVATGRSPRERELFEGLVRSSYLEFARLVGQGFGVLPRTNYTVGSAGGALRRLPLDLIPPVRQLERLPFAGGARSGQAFETFLIEPPLYLARLEADLRARGVVFEERHFAQRSELEALPGQALVNCLGLGAADLFEDEALVPIRGQLVLLEPQDLPYLLSHTGYLFPRSDALVLGGTVERGVTDERPDPLRCERIRELHAEFFGLSC